MDIPRMIESVLADANIEDASSLQQVITADDWARHAAQQWMKASGIKPSGLESSIAC